jgi:hypothetical protein
MIDPYLALLGGIGQKADDDDQSHKGTQSNLFHKVGKQGYVETEYRKEGEHKIYNHALRNTSEKITNTDVQGRSIGVIEAGKTFTYEGTIPVSKASWNWENMGVLVIVSAKDAQGRWEIVNSAYCKVGESKPYEYWVEDVVEE